MCKNAVLLLIYAIVTIVTTAPVYHHGEVVVKRLLFKKRGSETTGPILMKRGTKIARGPSYTLSSTPDHRKPYLEVRNSTYHGSGPREEARAMCSVRTQEINATANATITRRLHGVVTSRELHSSIQRLEVIIFGQMQQLWQSIDALRAQLAGETRTSFPDRRTMVFRYKPGVK